MSSSRSPWTKAATSLTHVKVWTSTSSSATPTASTPSRCGRGGKRFRQHVRKPSYGEADEEAGGIGGGIQPLRGQQRRAEGHPETAGRVPQNLRADQAQRHEVNS